MMYNMPMFEQIQRFSKISSVNFPDFTNFFNRKNRDVAQGLGGGNISKIVPRGRL